MDTAAKRHYAIVSMKSDTGFSVCLMTKIHTGVCSNNDNYFSSIQSSLLENVLLLYLSLGL